MFSKEQNKQRVRVIVDPCMHANHSGLRLVLTFHLQLLLLQPFHHHRHDKIFLDGVCTKMHIQSNSSRGSGAFPQRKILKIAPFDINSEGSFTQSLLN